MRKFSIVPAILVLLGVTFALTPETVSLAEAEKLAGAVNCDTPGLDNNTSCKTIPNGDPCYKKYSTCFFSEPGNDVYYCRKERGSDACTPINCVHIRNDVLAPCDTL